MWFAWCFVRAALAAAVVFDGILSAQLVTSVWNKVSDEILISDIFMIIFIYPFILFFVLLLSVLPAWFIFQVARRWRLENWTPFTVAGVIIGIGASMIYTLWSQYIFGTEDDDGNVIRFAVAWWRIAWLAGISGLIGGWVFWWGNRSRRSEDFI